MAHRPRPDDGDDALSFLLFLRLVPSGGLLQEQMPREHHHEVHARENQEHLVDTALAEVLKHGLHDGARDCLRRAEPRHGKTGRQPLLVLEPEHERLDRRKVARPQPHAHDEAVADVDADERDNAVRMMPAVPDEAARSRHAEREADRRNQRGLVDVLLHDVPQERRRHTEEENGEAERPFRRALGEANVVRYLLRENRPAVHRTDAAMQQERRNGGANPFVFFHYAHFLLFCHKMS